MNYALIIVLSFLLMEPLTYLAHKHVMHGVGWTLHASHHRPRETVVELNDLFPLFFAVITMGAFLAGTQVHGLRYLIPTGVGVTVYGLAYSFVHDVYIHGRFFKVGRISLLEPLKQAHILHHMFNGEPYGMLIPIVPKSIRSKAERLFAAQGTNPYDPSFLQGPDLSSGRKYIVVE
ncbi:beta-carotene 3-hydroxylase [Ferrithrix thermotolerans DSM 19514]|jgi:beta-carotene 3-hydroxylase|uniref:Beta-carotene 3-hydroxylase n=1 Tax=Ferrithrix thermotolerans DSM 19514 TaxID=1121881 RepID=A0A1M4X1N3_9ACTN|nr:beta-carotene hydroxylase [Ferrithrix thermotolerans]SHE87355.1 beta-carotene 3-hydroxylase [Ferrithrix thermotolerans DSM 19514]